MSKMRGKAFEVCTDELIGLRFVAGTVMKAVMLYKADKTSELAIFGNAFDRLDDADVRRDLWRQSQER